MSNYFIAISKGIYQNNVINFTSWKPSEIVDFFSFICISCYSFFSLAKAHFFNTSTQAQANNQISQNNITKTTRVYTTSSKLNIFEMTYQEAKSDLYNV